jgi:hypothetical protein
MTPDSLALPVWTRVVELLGVVSEEDFYEEMRGVFYYVDAVCYGAERGGTSTMIPLLEKLHAYAPFRNKTAYEGFQPDYIQERLAYLELVIGRALARCGSAEGFVILASYLNDSRALLAEHAHTELVEVLLQRDLVVELEGTYRHLLHRHDGEVEQDGLLDPGVGRPLARGIARGHTQLALIERGDGVENGLLDGGIGEQRTVGVGSFDFRASFSVIHHAWLASGVGRSKRGSWSGLSPSCARETPY